MGIGTAIDEDEEWQATVADENGEKMIEARRFMGDEMRDATRKKKQDGTRCLTRMDVKLMLKSSQKKCNKNVGGDNVLKHFFGRDDGQVLFIFDNIIENRLLDAKIRAHARLIVIIVIR